MKQITSRKLQRGTRSGTNQLVYDPADGDNIELQGRGIKRWKKRKERKKERDRSERSNKSMDLKDYEFVLEKASIHS